MVEIVFLGTGGGRIATCYQTRNTGGFLIKTGNIQMHCDPGPGTLNAMKEMNENPFKTNIIFCSHEHTDHFNDVGLMIECMSNCGTEQRGIFIGKKELTDIFHKKLVEKEVILKPYETFEFKNIKLTATPCKHDRNPIGFILKIKEDVVKKIGYTSDTDFMPQLSDIFDNCNLIIFNCTRPYGKGLSKHLSTDKVINILNGINIKPELVVITHFGQKMIDAGPNFEARKIERETGIRTIAVKDGEKIRF